MFFWLHIFLGWLFLSSAAPLGLRGCWMKYFILRWEKSLFCTAGAAQTAGTWPCLQMWGTGTKHELWMQLCVEQQTFKALNWYSFSWTDSVSLCCRLSVSIRQSHPDSFCSVESLIFGSIIPSVAVMKHFCVRKYHKLQITAQIKHAEFEKRLD